MSLKPSIAVIVALSCLFAKKNSREEPCYVSFHDEQQEGNKSQRETTLTTTAAAAVSFHSCNNCKINNNFPDDNNCWVSEFEQVRDPFSSVSSSDF